MKVIHHAKRRLFRFIPNPSALLKLIGIGRKNLNDKAMQYYRNQQRMARKSY